MIDVEDDVAALFEEAQALPARGRRYFRGEAMTVKGRSRSRSLVSASLSRLEVRARRVALIESELRARRVTHAAWEPPVQDGLRLCRGTSYRLGDHWMPVAAFQKPSGKPLLLATCAECRALVKAKRTK